MILRDVQGNLYIQWVSRVPDVSESAQDTAHWKNAEKEPHQHNTIPKYNEAVQNYNYCHCIKDNWQLMKDWSYFSKEALNTTGLNTRGIPSS